MKTGGEGWRILMRREWLPALAVLLGGVLLHSMNVLLLATVLPTVVAEVGGAALMSWPTTAFLASSIVAATCTGLLTAAVGARVAYTAGALVFSLGAGLCSLAPDMGWIVAGRFVQGLGGGVLTAVAYIVVRATFPEAAWARAIALLSGMWSVSIVVGPLAGGAFARWGAWRGVFVMVAAFAIVLALGALRALPAVQKTAQPLPRVPGVRVALLCFAIAGTSLAAVAGSLPTKAGLIAAALATLALTIRIDRRAPRPLLPSDAFALGSPTGLGMWLTLLLSISYSPIQIYVPIFLQRLHGFDPLAAGYATAGASFGWTITAVAVAGASAAWSGRLIVLGPVIMAAGLLAVAWFTPRAVAPLLPAIVVVGAGIGAGWAFVAQRVMSGARPGDEAVAASAIPPTQQMGFALGGALAGLTANTVGLGGTRIADAAFWVPIVFVVPALLAFAVALRLRYVRQAATSSQVL